MMQYPIHNRPQGWTGDRKCNVVLLRVIAGALMFAAMIMTLISVIYYTQPCCGDRWNNDTEKYEETCKARNTEERLLDDENSSSNRNCYKQSMISLGVWIAAVVIIITSFVLLVVAEMNNTKEDSDKYLDAVRVQSSQERIERIARRSERKDMKTKAAKYEKRAQEKMDRELSMLEARRNSYPGTAPAYVHQVPMQSFDGGYSHYSTQPQYVQQQQYVQPSPYVYGNRQPTRVVYSSAASPVYS